MTVQDYVYDANGNATKDGLSKVGFTYNYLNLPATAVRTTDEPVNLSYTYDATGNKLVKNSNGTVRNYVDGIEYKPDGTTIDIIHTEEGIARNSGGIYSYEYNLGDHLGNVRATFYKNPNTNLLEVLQRDDYYAFGLRKVASGGTNKYLYNGKELQEELGQYDYGARFYDPVVARFSTIDPMSEASRRFSSYAYAVNNPIRFIDVDGMYAASPIYADGPYVGTDDQGFNGEIITMSRAQYGKLSETQKDEITNGTMKHSEAMKLGPTLGQKIDALDNAPGGTRVDQEVKEINLIINNVVSKTEGITGFEPKKLFGGSISSAYDNYAMSDRDRVYGEANGRNTSFAMANFSAGNKITFNLQSWGKDVVDGDKNPTVANLQSTYVHEGKGHWKSGLGSSRTEHSKVLLIQMNHPTFKRATPIFQQYMKALYYDYTH